MPGKYKENMDSYTDTEEEQGSILSMLITYIALIAAAALICTVVWVVTHKTPKQDLDNMSLPVTPSLGDTLVAESLAEPIESISEEEEEVEPVAGDATMTFEKVDEEVTAKDVAFLRSEPTPDGIQQVVGQLKNGETIKRIGINKETGWSKVVYNGEEVYAVTYLITKNLDYKPETPENPANRVVTSEGHVVLFKDCDEIVTAKEYVNLRTEPSTSLGAGSVSTQLNNGSTARRTGISVDSGWSRVEYNGEVLYVVGSYVQKFGQ